MTEADGLLHKNKYVCFEVVTGYVRPAYKLVFHDPSDRKDLWSMEVIICVAALAGDGTENERSLNSTSWKHCTRHKGQTRSLTTVANQFNPPYAGRGWG